jgi:hypothetical protein
MSTLHLLEYFRGWQIGIVRETFGAPSKTRLLGHDNNPWEQWADAYADYKARLRSPFIAPIRGAKG